MIVIREPESIHHTSGAIRNGTFSGRWHFSLDEYLDPSYMQFGTLRVFNDVTLSPGASWPPHPHSEVVIVTYCAEGEFRHQDDRGGEGALRKGGVQRMTIGRGLQYSQVNGRADAPMRYIQMWFHPSACHLDPLVERKDVDRSERTNRFLALVSPADPAALLIHADAEIFSCSLEKGREVEREILVGRGAYLYVLEGGPVDANGQRLRAMGAAKLTDEARLSVRAEDDAELLLADVRL